MSTDHDNFKAWFADVLASLYPIRDAGIVVFMISLPLAERYLRQKCNVGPEADLSDDCMRILMRFFPKLTDLPKARTFWNVYRHGFMHQATLSTSTRRGARLPVGWLSHDIADEVEIRSDGSFCVHPVLFSQTIVRAIEAEFAAFAGVASGAPPLAKVAPLSPIVVPNPYVGTHGG
jgi:hypothetical protein